MSEPIAIISSDKIMEKDFLEFLSQQGANLDSASGFQGQITKDDQNLWIEIDETVLQNYRDGDSPEDFEFIRETLGGEPQTCVVVEISRKDKSKQLAFKFAAAFARKWNAVVDDSPNGIYSAKEIFELEKAA